jgi:rubrerythrin
MQRKNMAGKEDLLLSLIDAFLMEKGTKVFYAEAAEKAVNTEAKKTFTCLSEWEGKHMDFILFLYRAINDDRDIVTYEEFKNKADATLTEAGIPIKDLEAKMEKYSVTDELGALILAMEIEGKAYNMYRRLSRSAEDKNAGIVFNEMMEQEVKHVTYLKKLRVKLANIYE